MPRLLRFLVLCSNFWAMAALAQPTSAPAPYRLRVVGGLAGVSQYTRWEEPFWSRELARLSGGRFGADIVPFDRAGVPGPEMLRLLQLGVVPFGTVLLSALNAQHPQLTAPDLAGLNPDMASLRVSLSAFRPYLEKTLREQFGVELLAVYTYPAQVLFCKRPLAGLADLAGRRIRVSSVSQADFLTALGAQPVSMAFADVVPNLQNGNVECVTTGTMSGNTVGLHTLTGYMHSMQLNWGLAIFGANRAAWETLPPELRSLLRRELPKLEMAIWEDSERDTADGFACNSGGATCKGGRKGAMVLVPVSAQDERRRQDIFQATVLPQWIKRCGSRCAEIWSQTIGPARRIPLPSPPPSP